MKRILCFCLCLCILLSAVCVSAVATDNSDEPNMLKNKGDQFVKEHGLTEEDFAVYFYNPATREEYVYNENAFLPVGGNWILPLHMYYYEHETLGEFDPPIENPDEVYKIEGLTLEKCRYRSILMGDEEVSRQMRDNLGTVEQYLTLINEQYGHIEPEELPESYYHNNCYSATFLMNCLKRISAYPELYRDMMQNFSLVQTDDGVAAYDRPYSLVHLRGEQNDYICDLAEVSATDTYLLVCFASEDAGGDTLLAEVNTLFCNYVEQTFDVEENNAPTSGRWTHKDEDYQSGSIGRSQKNKEGSIFWILIALAIASAVAGIIGLIYYFLRRKEDQKWDDLQIRRWREHSSGKHASSGQTVKCKCCGAMTIPDKDGRCEICRGFVDKKPRKQKEKEQK